MSSIHSPVLGVEVLHELEQSVSSHINNSPGGSRPSPASSLDDDRISFTEEASRSSPKDDPGRDQQQALSPLSPHKQTHSLFSF